MNKVITSGGFEMNGVIIHTIVYIYSGHVTPKVRYQPGLH